jgi:hypothetical protein
MTFWDKGLDKSRPSGRDNKPCQKLGRYNPTEFFGLSAAAAVGNGLTPLSAQEKAVTVMPFPSSLL